MPPPPEVKEDQEYSDFEDIQLPEEERDLLVEQRGHDACGLSSGDSDGGSVDLNMDSSGGGGCHNQDGRILQIEEISDELKPTQNKSCEVKVMRARFCGMFLLEAKASSENNDCAESIDDGKWSSLIKSKKCHCKEGSGGPTLHMHYGPVQ